MSDIEASELEGHANDQGHSLYPTRRSPTANTGPVCTQQTAVDKNARSRSSSSSCYAATNNTQTGLRVPSDSSTAVGCQEFDDKITPAASRSSLSFALPGDATPDTRHLHHWAPHATSRQHFDPLTPEEQRLAQMYRHAQDKRSAVPIFYFLAASLGKLILGFGVSLAIKGHYGSDKLNFGLGIGLAAAGFIAVVAAALGFGAAVSMINKRWGIICKCFSIGGGILISIGYALKQYFVSDDKPLFAIRLAFIPLALGTAFMGISLPNFTAYTELYRGRVAGFPPHRRPLIALVSLSPSMGILFGGWISTEVADWPVAFHSAVLTFAVALGYCGVALFWSNNLRQLAQSYEQRLYHEEQLQEFRASLTGVPSIAVEKTASRGA